MYTMSAVGRCTQHLAVCASAVVVVVGGGGQHPPHAATCTGVSHVAVYGLVISASSGHIGTQRTPHPPTDPA